MKKEIREPEFKPVAIVFESEEEMRGLWHIVNCSEDETLRCYLERGREQHAIADEACLKVKDGIKELIKEDKFRA